MFCSFHKDKRGTNSMRACSFDEIFRKVCPNLGHASKKKVFFHFTEEIINVWEWTLTDLGEW